ncbi:Ig-like domain repeat protein [Nocardioides hankookensis]|uniref:Ig-like domain repeat protein n=1 Tax=Nocardioides hankookensis TaxID=443157 RepID=A0ABW1LLS6_9ACTN
MTAAPAMAAYAPDADDSKTTTITSTDLVGVGSDTSQHALKLLADAWNGGARTDYGQTFDVASFSALGGGTLPAPLVLDQGGADVPRPSGSGPGRNTLFGATRVSNVDFARSSSSPSAQNFTDGMRVIPFALDTVVVAVSGTSPVASFNPTLTLDQLKAIYKTCTLTNWHDVNAAYPSQPIEPFIPKSGSGTEDFFKKSGVLPSNDLTYGACVKDHTDDSNADGTRVQEHDPGLFTLKPNAIVPFSKGRAALTNGAVKAVAGDEVAFKRNLYNVVRADEASRADIQAFFGEDGFVCSAAAHDIIKSAGFDQLATSALNGDCGKVLNAASSNYTINTVTTPTVAVTGAGTSAGYNLTATLTSDPTAVGTVTFSENGTELAADVPIVSGRAVSSPIKLAAGSHSVKAVYTPGASNFLGAEKTSTLVVKAPKVKSVIAESFPAKVKLKKKAKTATVSGVVSVKGATGKVSVKLGKKVLKTVALKGGKAKVALAKLKKGAYKLTIAYAGDATHLAGTKTFTVKVVK